MRILLITDSYLPTRDGNVTMAVATRDILQKMGHEVFICAP